MPIYCSFQGKEYDALMSTPRGLEWWCRIQEHQLERITVTHRWLGREFEWISLKKVNEYYFPSLSLQDWATKLNVDSSVLSQLYRDYDAAQRRSGFNRFLPKCFQSAPLDHAEMLQIPLSRRKVCQMIKPFLDHDQCLFVAKQEFLTRYAKELKSSVRHFLRANCQQLGMNSKDEVAVWIGIIKYFLLNCHFKKENLSLALLQTLGREVFTAYYSNFNTVKACYQNMQEALLCLDTKKYLAAKAQLDNSLQKIELSEWAPRAKELVEDREIEEKLARTKQKVQAQHAQVSKRYTLEKRVMGPPRKPVPKPSKAVPKPSNLVSCKLAFDENSSCQ